MIIISTDCNVQLKISVQLEIVQPAVKHSYAKSEHTMSNKKVIYYYFYDNFGKCGASAISITGSLLYLVINCRRGRSKCCHLISNQLPHYLWNFFWKLFWAIASLSRQYNNEWVSKQVMERQRTRYNVVRSAEVVFIIPDVDHAQCKYTEHVHCQRQQELKEVPVIPTTNTVINPRTVVIKCLQPSQHKHNTL